MNARKDDDIIVLDGKDHVIWKPVKICMPNLVRICRIHQRAVSDLAERTNSLVNELHAEPGTLCIVPAPDFASLPEDLGPDPKPVSHGAFTSATNCSSEIAEPGSCL